MKRNLVAAVFLSLACCNYERPIESKIHDNANGVDLVIEHHAGPALSQPEDKLYLIDNGERKLVFEGYGGSSLSLPALRKGVLIVAYCGGAIRSAESFLSKESSVSNMTAVKIQPIITSGIQINGKSLCNG